MSKPVPALQRLSDQTPSTPFSSASNESSVFEHVTKVIDAPLSGQPVARCIEGVTRCT
ncbi:MAG: hypothetical protein IPJ04_06285 [Candidatus Eisenbacteria bacterium]|nr:hypothetical protein [Candidatus Eisenbacteria bacterium]